jgi:zinc protease
MGEPGATRPRQPPAVLPPQRFAPPPFHRRTLANGMHVLVAPRSVGVPLVDVHIVTRGGASFDPPPVAGRAALTAALLHEGTQQRSAMDIADALEHLGARLSVRTGWDAWTLALRVLEPRLAAALDVAGDIVANATLPDDAFQRKRAERRAEWLNNRSEPGVLAAECFHRAVFGSEHPYAAPLFGSDASLAALQRQHVARLHTGALQPRHSFIVVTGAVDVDAVTRQLDATLGRWSAAAADDATLQPALPAALPAPAHAAPAIHVVPRPGAGQSEVRAGHAGPPRNSPDYFPLLVLNTILGGAFTSRLNRTLREEKGYTYGARSSLAFRRHGGPFLIRVAVFSDATADTVAIIHETVARLRQDPIPAAELERAASYLARGLPRLIESGGQHAEELAAIALHGLDDDFLAGYVEQIAAVTGDDVQRAAQRHLDEAALCFAIAGDARRVAPGLADLAIAQVLVESE